MKVQRIKLIAAITGISVISMLLFQNCSKVSVSDVPSIPSQSLNAAAGTSTERPIDPIVEIPAKAPAVIQINASPATVVEGQQSILTVTFQNVENVTYLCTDRVSNEILASGLISSSGQQLGVKVDQDLHCEFTGQDISGTNPVHAYQDLTLDCANRIKNTAQNKCQDFSCQKFIELTSLNELLNIPARDSNGICYAMKLLNQIKFSSSSLNTTVDQDVTSRNHDQDRSQNPNHHPYQMGSVKTEFRIYGPRVVKLSGGLSATTPIRVDNFVLLGVYPTGTDVSANLSTVYSARGTSDSAVLDASGRQTTSIEFLDTLISVIPYGTGGTGSVSAVDITRSAQPKIFQTLDIRALDCGGSRELSDIYLLFQ